MLLHLTFDKLIFKKQFANRFRSKRCDKIYVASERIKKIAKRRGRYPDSKIVMSGLPIRQSFTEEEAKLDDRTSEAGKAYQKKVREDLSIGTDKQMVLVMGGGEGVFSSYIMSLRPCKTAVSPSWQLTKFELKRIVSLRGKELEAWSGLWMNSTPIS